MVTNEDIRKMFTGELDPGPFLSADTFWAKPLGLMVNEDDGSTGVYVVGNDAAHFGAVGIFDSGVRTKLRNVYQDGFYILPSSVHEVLCVPKNRDPKELASMVRNINREAVLEQDRLSDNVYELVEGRLVVVA